MAAHCSGCVFMVCVCVHGVCVHFGWDKCRAQIPSMGHHLAVCHITYLLTHFTYTHLHLMPYSFFLFTQEQRCYGQEKSSWLVHKKKKIADPRLLNTMYKRESKTFFYFAQQGCIKLFKSHSKDMYNVTENLFKMLINAIIILNKYNSLFSHKNIKNVNYFQHW